MRHLFFRIGVNSVGGLALWKRIHGRAAMANNGSTSWSYYPLNILEQLKTGTSHLHQALESELDLFRPGLRICEYMELLERFYGFYVVWDPEVARRLGHISELELQRRTKTPGLAADLMYLGYAANRLSRLPRCTDIPRFHSPEMLLGGLYVTEGSTLGGRFLAEHFGQTLGVRASAGATFFSSYGAELGSMWNRFRSSLLNSAAPENEADIVQGAVLTFECMHAWLCSERTALA